ncbi:hypothetical protein GCM10022252_40970 [Streptosporangium oxazolinicum]|uniref:Uncharacterized protein n=1 Tax=Streptosporangium oxazolinicum TaxID=909287 RepID=A0ABP8B117_9ACTN
MVKDAQSLACTRHSAARVDTGRHDDGENSGDGGTETRWRGPKRRLTRVRIPTRVRRRAREPEAVS